MKLLTTILCILILGIRCAAQKPLEKIQIEQKIVRYGKMKNVGAASTVLGAIAMIAGVAIINANNSSILGGESNNWGTGVGLFIVGVAGVGSGMPLWGVGSHNERKYKAQLTGLSVRLNVRPGYRGLGLSYRF